MKLPKISKKKILGSILLGGLIGIIGAVGYQQYVAKPEVYIDYQIDKHQSEKVIIENKFIYTTEVGHQKVILGMGGLWERVQGPGLNFRFPLEKAYDVDVLKVTKLERGFRTKKAGIKTVYEKGNFDDESLMVTGDEGELKIEYIAQYIKKDPNAFLFNVKMPHETVAEVVESALREIIAKHKYEGALTTEKEAIQSETYEIAQSVLNDYDVGIKLISILLQKIQPPKESVQKAFDGIQNARQDKDTYIQNALTVKISETKKAEGSKLMIIEQAKGAASEKVNIAKGRTERFVNLYKGFQGKNLDMHRLRLTHETFRELLKNADVIIIDKNAKGNLLQHLMIDEKKGGAK